MFQLLNLFTAVQQAKVRKILQLYNLKNFENQFILNPPAHRMNLKEYTDCYYLYTYLNNISIPLIKIKKEIKKEIKEEKILNQKKESVL